MKSNVPVGFFRHEDFENLRNKARKVLTPMFTELVVSTEEPFIQAIFDGVIPAMAFGRICIMDDAAFAARPHCGAGTVKAAEDAWQLGSTLAEIGNERGACPPPMAGTATTVRATISRPRSRNW